MIARLADGHDGLVCGPLARKALRGILRAYDCSPETAALASLWLGRPQRAAPPPRGHRRLLKNALEPTRRPSMPSRPRLFQSTVPGSSGGWSGRRRAAASRWTAPGLPEPRRAGRALAALAALDAEVAPFSSPVRRFAAAGAAPAQPPPASSIFDDFAAAPQRPAPAPPAASSIFDDFDAAPPRKPPPPPQAESSIFDGFDAAPQRQAPPPPPQSSIFDEFDAAPQQRQPSMLDGFDAAPQQPKSAAVDARRL